MSEERLPSPSADLLRLLACPACREGELAGLDGRMVDGAVTCMRCGAAYPVRGGIPVLLPPGFDATHVHDEIDHAHGHKHQQAEYFDRGVAEEFEISRPHGAPEAYRALIEEKFRRSIARLPSLAGATVLDACCGSGMDAEMLARQGARVIAIDISEGCAARTKARAERYGLDYLVVVGDVEHLPLRAAAVDISYVHDGLHHLAEPAAGVRELARVARVAVSVNEPAAAFGTEVMVRLGVSQAWEDAGNRVARLRPDDVARVLAGEGFADVRAQRYLMFYRHEPGTVMRLASRPVAKQAYRAAAAVADAALGRWGNKLQVTARRAA
jgi:SAM-dependent methyltransferase